MEFIIKFLHIIGAITLMGTGAGIAFFMVMAHKTKNPTIIAHVASSVVIADMIFTATAVILQPITGIWLTHNIGWPIFSGWVGLSIILYLLVGAFWLPVVFIQLKIRNLARIAVASNSPLPPTYQKLYKIWFACGVPAFLMVLAIIWLMIAKPEISPLW